MYIHFKAIKSDIKTKILFAVFLSFTFNLNAQKASVNSLTVKLSNDWCACMGKNITRKNIRLCANKIIEDNKDNISKADYGNENFGYDFGKSLFKKVQKDLVNNCDTYYKYLLETEELKFRKKFSINVNQVRDSIAIRNLTQRRDANFYYLRAGDYFSLKEFDNCLSDLDSANIIDIKNPLPDFMRAEYYEYRNEYAKAISYYKSSGEILKLDFGETIAFLERKAKSYNRKNE